MYLLMLSWFWKHLLQFCADICKRLSCVWTKNSINWLKKLFMREAIYYKLHLTWQVLCQSCFRYTCKLIKLVRNGLAIFLWYVYINDIILLRWWQVPYYWAGIKLYDLVSGKQLIRSSYLLGREKSLERFPMLKRDKLKASIVYYDGETKIIPFSWYSL